MPSPSRSLPPAAPPLRAAFARRATIHDSPEDQAILCVDIAEPDDEVWDVFKCMAGDHGFANEVKYFPHVWKPRFSGPGECEPTGFLPAITA